MAPSKRNVSQTVSMILSQSCSMVNMDYHWKFHLPLVQRRVFSLPDTSAPLVRQQYRLQNGAKVSRDNSAPVFYWCRTVWTLRTSAEIPVWLMAASQLVTRSTRHRSTRHPVDSSRSRLVTKRRLTRHKQTNKQTSKLYCRSSIITITGAGVHVR